MLIKSVILFSFASDRYMADLANIFNLFSRYSYMQEKIFNMSFYRFIAYFV